MDALLVHVLRNADRASRAAAALRELDFDPVDVDEEASSDGYWHVAAFKVGHVPDVELRQLAQQFGGTYLGCSIAVLGDGSLPDPDRPLT